MKIALHVGAHCTDEGRLARTLARNRDDLLARRVSVPPPGNYKVLLREALHALDRGEPSAEAKEVLLDTILQADDADHMILLNDNFFGTPRMAMKAGQFYPIAEQRLADMRQLFPDCEIGIFLAIRDPGTFVPAVHAQASGTTLDQVLNGTDPGTLRWSDLVRRMRRHGRLHCSPLGVSVSARRWERDGWMRRTVSNLWILLLYLAGRSPDRLAASYSAWSGPGRPSDGDGGASR